MTHCPTNLLSLVRTSTAGAALLASASVYSALNYAYRPITIGGGGYFTNIVFSPSQPGVSFLRSDVTGPWRRDSINEPWHTKLIANYLMLPPDAGKVPYTGASAIAFHPANSLIAVAEMGQPRSGVGAGGVFTTVDGGNSWVQRRASNTIIGQGFPSLFASAARKWNEAIEFDPKTTGNTTAVVYWGTAQEGIWRSTDSGQTWTQRYTPQNGETVLPGSRCVVVDGSSATVGSSARSSVVYASLYGVGLLRSTDGGDTFSELDLPNGRFAIRTMKVASDGYLYVTHELGVLRYNPSEGWVDITPGSGNPARFEGLAIDPTDPTRLVVLGTFSPAVIGATQVGAGACVLFRGTGRGTSWTTFAPIRYNYATTLPGVPFSVDPASPPPLDSDFRGPAAGTALAMDPFNAGHLYVTDAFAVWRTTNIWAATPTWFNDVAGAESYIGLSIMNPPRGTAAAGNEPAPLFVGMSDVRGFRVADVNLRPGEYIDVAGDFASYNNGWDYQNSTNSQNLVVAKQLNTSIGRVLLSTNGGRTWAATPTQPLAADFGTPRIAMSSGTNQNLVFVPGASNPIRYTTNGGSTWNTAIAASGNPSLPSFAVDSPFGYRWHNVIASDKQTAGTFYAYRAYVKPEARIINPSSPTWTIEVWASTDGGATWALKSEFPGSNPADDLSPVLITVNPSVAGEVWISTSAGIYKSTAGGASMTKVSGFNDKRSTFLAFGKEAPGQSMPALYVMGERTSDTGLGLALYRSIDGGANWTLLDRDGIQRYRPRLLGADMQKYGRVYFSDAQTSPFYVGDPILAADTFEAGTIGSAPAGWGGGNLQIASTSTTDNRKVLSLVDNSASANTNATKLFTATSGTITAEWQCRTPAASGFPFRLMNGGSIVTSVETNNTHFIYRTGPSTTVNLQTYTPGVWYTCKVVVDLPAARYDVYIDNVRRASNVPLYTAVPSVDRFFISTNNAYASPTEHLQVDDLTITE